MKTNAKNLKDMTKPELIEFCKEQGIEVKQSLKKNEILDLIESHSKKDPEREPDKTAGNEKKVTSLQKEPAEMPNIHIMDDGDVIETDQSLNKYDIALAQSREDKTNYLTGIVGGVVDTGEWKNPKTGEIIKYGTLYVRYGNRIVYIPSFNFFENWEDPVLFSPDKWYQNLQNRMNSKVDFVIAMMEKKGDEYEYYGTRFPAMIERRKRWYAKKPGTEDWYLDEGSLARARVVEAKEAGLVLDIEGAETFMPAKELGNHYVRKANSNIRVGSTITVRVFNIQRAAVPRNTSNFKYPVKYDASVRLAVKNPQEVYFHLFNKGSSHVGTVSNIIRDKEGRIRFYVNVGKEPNIVSVYCKMLAGVHKTPSIDDIVCISIDGNDPGTLKIWGKIIHVADGEDDLMEFSIVDLEDEVEEPDEFKEA